MDDLNGRIGKYHAIVRDHRAGTIAPDSMVDSFVERHPRRITQRSAAAIASQKQREYRRDNPDRTDCHSQHSSKIHLPAALTMCDNFVIRLDRSPKPVWRWLVSKPIETVSAGSRQIIGGSGYRPSHVCPPDRGIVGGLQCKTAAVPIKRHGGVFPKQSGRRAGNNILAE